MLAADFYIKGKLVAKNVKVCKSFRLKLLGLMFVSSPGNGAFLPDVSSIHMNFVRFGLRIIWLDKEYKVVGQVYAKQWRFYNGPANSVHVLELPITNKSTVRLGDRLKVTTHDRKTGSK